MTIEEFKEKIRRVKGVSEVKEYSLVSNYGVTFKKGGYSFDIRYWANCYGVALNYWSIMPSKEFAADGKNVNGPKTAHDLSEFVPVVEGL